jgi:hypothetical protein
MLAIAQSALAGIEACLSGLPGSLEEFCARNTAFAIVHCELAVHSDFVGTDQIDVLLSRRHRCIQSLEQFVTAALDTLFSQCDARLQQVKRSLEELQVPLLEDVDVSLLHQQQMDVTAILRVMDRSDVPTALGMEHIQPVLTSIEYAMAEYFRTLVELGNVCLAGIRTEEADTGTSAKMEIKGQGRKRFFTWVPDGLTCGRGGRVLQRRVLLEKF